MYPYLTIFGYRVGTYGLCACLGFAAVLICVRGLARERGHSGEDELIMVLACVIPVLLGGSLVYGLTNLPAIIDVLGHAGEYPSVLAVMGALAPSFGGIVFYGGVLGGLAALAVGCHLKGRQLTYYLDLFAVVVPLFQMFGRVGCFFGGCCFGIEAPVGFVYTLDPIAQANGVTRFPVQLLEATCDLVIFLILLKLYRSHRADGRLLCDYFILYGTVRFFDEFLRGDAYRGFLGPLSTSQWISIALIAVAVLYLMRHRPAAGERALGKERADAPAQTRAPQPPRAERGV